MTLYPSSAVERAMKMQEVILLVAPLVGCYDEPRTRELRVEVQGEARVSWGGGWSLLGGGDGVWDSGAGCAPLGLA